MNTKKFLIAGLIGGIVDWLLGWLLYGIALADYFPQPKQTFKTMFCIFAGCMTFGFFISYIYNRWAQISTAGTGAKAGAIIGFFMGVNASLFNVAMVKGVTYAMFALDVSVSIILATVVGAVVGAVNGMLNKSA